MANNESRIYDIEKRFNKFIAKDNHGDIGDIVSSYQFLPALRGFWPMASINESGNVIDMANQDRTLTNNAAAPFAVSGFVCYASLNGSTQYFSRADEAGLDITTALTIGGWFRPTALGANVMPMSKDGAAAGQLAYHLQFLTANQFQFQISSNGTAAVAVTNAKVTCAANTWYFAAGRYTPSTELKVWTNGTSEINTTSVPAACFGSTAQFEIGRWASGGAGSRFFPGDVSLLFMCSFALPDHLIANLYNSSRIFFGV